MNSGKSEEPGVTAWLVQRPSWPMQAATAILLLVVIFEAYRRSGTDGMDNAFVVRAAHRFLDGGSPYSDRRFLYLPSSVLAAVPEALLPTVLLRLLVPAVTTALVLTGWWCALRIFEVPGRSRLGILVSAGLAFFAPFRSLVLLGNWTAACAAALPCALLLITRSRWTAAGAVVGVAIALKPMLIPFALIFLFARRPRALAAAAVIPAVGSVAAAITMPNPTFFFSRTLPFLLHGQDQFARPFDASLIAVLPRLGVPPGVALVVAAAAAGGGVWCAWRRWSGAGIGGTSRAERLRLVETGAMLMLSAFLVSRPSFEHYALVVLPTLLASAVVQDSVVRTPWFWLALVPQVPVIQWPLLVPVTRRAFKDAAMLCGLAVVLAWRCLRGRRVLVPEQGGAAEARAAGSRAAF
ncbi:glycosyltransferase 87 family protein [Streptantibioticus ferralitis]|uniref:Glycosyltransferase 87 family protein n=1 Tax=Streptantibioticus ferralitis TaxID=236510 RepID=A0ABT5Z7M4_9ACTN|nr:glycosyltransferase 87 family protein [Streptantibioticus ferralitis]MDF2259546.1 glycosyltransferase 87 family protein [Streptantibioticus ferralitis]